MYVRYRFALCLTVNVVLFYLSVICLTVVLIIISHQVSKAKSGKTGWSHDLAGVCFIPITCLILLLFLERYYQHHGHLCCNTLNTDV